VAGRRPLLPGKRQRLRVRQDAQYVADADGVAFGVQDALQDARPLGGDLLVHLFRLQLDEEVTGTNGLPFSLEPASHGRLDDRLPEGRHSKLYRHITSSDG
jgi:hypothetical protein